MGGSRSNSDFQHEMQAVLSKTIHFIKHTSEGEGGGWPHSHIHDTTGPSPIYHMQFPRLLTFDPLPRAVFVLRATCHCLSEASPEGHSGVCRRNMLLKPLMVKPPLCPACVSVPVCTSIIAFSPLVFYACCSLARQWPLTMKCRSGQYVRNPLGWERGGWRQKAVCFERRRRLEQKKRVKGMTGSLWIAWEQKRQFVQQMRRGFACFSLQQSPDKESARPQFNSATCLSEQRHYKPNESDYPDLLCSWDLEEQALLHACTSRTAAALTEALAPSSVCRLPSPYTAASGGGRWGGVQD